MLTRPKPFELGQADPSPSATAAASATPRASGPPTADFRFLPALTPPQVLPTPTPPAPAPSGSIAVGLATQELAP
ncbi:MAG TPA: hypothetical protein VK697_02455, partial [Methylomirabilota bacterium]|nr:hypothetical protein [Methylomirabilota bacterium]